MLLTLPNKPSVSPSKYRLEILLSQVAMACSITYQLSELRKPSRLLLPMEHSSLLFRKSSQNRLSNTGIIQSMTLLSPKMLNNKEFSSMEESSTILQLLSAGSSMDLVNPSLLISKQTQNSFKRSKLLKNGAIDGFNKKLCDLKVNIIDIVAYFYHYYLLKYN